VYVDRRLVRSACMGLMLMVCGVVDAQQSAAKYGEGAGLERAQRQAANPMRLIIEASRIKRREGVGTSDAGDASVQHRVAARGAAPESVTRDGTPLRETSLPSATAEGGEGVRVIVTLPAELPAVAMPVALPLDGISSLGAVLAPFVLPSMPELAAPLRAPKVAPSALRFIPIGEPLRS